MNLKYTLFGFLLFCSLSTAVSAQQATKADLQALELKLTNQMNEMDKRLTSQLTDLDKRLTRLEIKVEEMEKRLTIKIEELEKRLTVSMNILIGVVLAAIALPQVLGYLQGRREREEIQKHIQDLRADVQKQIQDLGERLDRQQQMLFEKLNQQQQDIEELKSRRIVASSG